MFHREAIENPIMKSYDAIKSIAKNLQYVLEVKGIEDERLQETYDTIDNLQDVLRDFAEVYEPEAFEKTLVRPTATMKRKPCYRQGDIAKKGTKVQEPFVSKSKTK